MSLLLPATSNPGTDRDAPRGPLHAALSRAGLPLLSLAVFFILWQFAAASGVWNQTFVPYPSSVWRAFVDVSTVHDGDRGYAGYLLWEHLYMTLRRVLAGVLIGVGLGVGLGLIMGSVPWVRRILEPWLTFLRTLPPLAYFFLLVIWLGIDEAPKVTLLVLAALPPAAVATTAAVVAAPVGLVEAARALGASRWEVIKESWFRRRFRRRSPVFAWPSGWRTPRWSPPSCSTAFRASTVRIRRTEKHHVGQRESSPLPRLVRCRTAASHLPIRPRPSARPARYGPR